MRVAARPSEKCETRWGRSTLSTRVVRNIAPRCRLPRGIGTLNVAFLASWEPDRPLRSNIPDAGAPGLGPLLGAPPPLTGSGGPLKLTPKSFPRHSVLSQPARLMSWGRRRPWSHRRPGAHAVPAIHPVAAVHASAGPMGLLQHTHALESIDPTGSPESVGPPQESRQSLWLPGSRYAMNPTAPKATLGCSALQSRAVPARGPGPAPLCAVAFRGSRGAELAGGGEAEVSDDLRPQRGRPAASARGPQHRLVL